MPEKSKDKGVVVLHFPPKISKHTQLVLEAAGRSFDFIDLAMLVLAAVCFILVFFV